MNLKEKKTRAYDQSHMEIVLRMRQFLEQEKCNTVVLTWTMF